MKRYSYLAVIIYLATISILIISTTSCTSGIDSDYAAETKICVDGFLCDTNNAGAENVHIAYEMSETAVGPGSGAIIRVGDNVCVTVPQNGFTEKSEISVIHGFTDEKIGYSIYAAQLPMKPL